MTQGKAPDTANKPEVNKVTGDKPEEEKMGIGQRIVWIVFAVAFVLMLTVFIRGCQR